MGNYATTSSISQLLPYVLKTNTTTGDTVGTANFSKHIDRAEGLVNGYIAGRYSLPFTTTPPILITITEDIASYYFIRSTYVQDGQRKNEYADAFKDAIGQLESIRDGKTPLSLTNGSLVPQITTSKYLSSTKGYSPTFNEDAPEDWEIDGEKLTDIGAGR